MVIHELKARRDSAKGLFFILKFLLRGATKDVYGRQEHGEVILHAVASGEAGADDPRSAAMWRRSLSFAQRDIC